ncbi:MAG TPA: V-type ATP synthase subunit F [Elusimicrobiales bacterium]|nr:V-type ATP synthase subunit F [Elusimicrobiales bacterium]
MAALKFYCIGDEDTARGFRLAGVEGRAVAGAAEAAAALAEVAARADLGVIIISPAAAELVRAKIEALRREREKPLIVEI